MIGVMAAGVTARAQSELLPKGQSAVFADVGTVSAHGDQGWNWSIGFSEKGRGDAGFRMSHSTVEYESSRPSDEPEVYKSDVWSAALTASDNFLRIEHNRTNVLIAAVRGSYTFWDNSPLSRYKTGGFSVGGRVGMVIKPTDNAIAMFLGWGRTFPSGTGTHPYNAVDFQFGFAHDFRTGMVMIGLKASSAEGSTTAMLNLGLALKTNLPRGSLEEEW